MKKKFYFLTNLKITTKKKKKNLQPSQSIYAKIYKSQTKKLQLTERKKKTKQEKKNRVGKMKRRSQKEKTTRGEWTIHIRQTKENQLQQNEKKKNIHIKQQKKDLFFHKYANNENKKQKTHNMQANNIQKTNFIFSQL